MLDLHQMRSDLTQKKTNVHKRRLRHLVNALLSLAHPQALG